MTQTDYLGNAITGATPAVIIGINDFIHGFLSYKTNAVNLLKCVDAAPDCLIANAYAGFLWMFLEAPEAPTKAAPYLERARAADGTEREKANARVLEAWINGDIPQVIRRCERIAKQHPTDLAIIKIAQYHLFNLGDAAGMLRLALHALPVGADAPYVHGMIAFGYEQCHLLDDAEGAALRALEIEPTDPWAHHALAHVMLTQGRTAEGIAFLESVADHWRDLNSFMRTHNWWHLALFYISEGRNAEVLDAYDRHVWGIEKGYSQDQVGAVSLLARMEFAGINVGDRWADVADHIAHRGDDTTSPFLTLQYYYALCRTHRPEADSLLRAIAARAAKKAHDKVAWSEVALPTAQAIALHLSGKTDAAIPLLERALPRMGEIGGSHAQRDLFEQIHLDALIKAGRASAAQQVLEMRRTFDPNGVPLNKMLAEVYEAVGLPDQARQATARITRRTV